MAGSRSTARRRPSRLAGRPATAAVVLLSAGLVVGGAQLLRPRAEEGRTMASAPEAVRLAPVEMVERAVVPRRFVGRVEAAGVQALAFERAGALVAVAVDEGDRVAEGEALAMLDVRVLEAGLAERRAARRAIEAQMELAELTAGRRRALEERGFSPTQAADEARLDAERLRARIAEADAAIDGLVLEIEKSTLVAPYHGRIGRRDADPGATLAAGAPVLTILQDAPPRMRVGLPPEIAEGIAPGDALEAEIGGRPLQATVLRIRPDLDPVTLTRAVVLALAVEDAVDGLTGSVTIPQEVGARGAWLPLSALREGERGLWTVLAPDPQGVLRALAVEVLAAEGDRILVAGPFEPGARIVAEGAHRVSPGQAVVAAGD